MVSTDGILNVNKPRGKTSFEVVAWLRGLSGEKRVGHAGTLDPAAEGVLPICFGKGTRVVQFLMDSAKTYQAQIELGIATDTYDSDGKIIYRGDPSSVTIAQVEEAITSFRGVIEQTPPIYSALKFCGKRYYELARAGIPVKKKTRKVEILRLEVVDWLPPVVTIEVECGKGTYIRSLAHDLGQLLGCGARLIKLVRSKYGFFHIEDALSTPQVEDAFQHSYWESLLYPTDSVLLSWGAAIVGQKSESIIRNGGTLSLSPEPRPFGLEPSRAKPGEEYCRTYSLDGQFIAVLHYSVEKGLWQPKKVFSP